MKKVKLALLVSAGLLATSAQAGWQGNWLLGVSGGWAWHNNDDDVTVSVLTPSTFASATFDNDNDNSHGIWGFLAGYQARCNGWLLGAEVNVDWRSNDDDDSFAFVTPAGTAFAATVSRDRDAVVGLTGRLGYEVSPFFMPYVRLGVDFGDRDHDFFLASTNLTPNITVTGSNDDNDRWGFVGGVGAEFPVPVIAGLSLRAEWNYHSRGNHGDDNNAFVASNGTTLIGVSGGNDRHEQTARASLVFNFPG